MLFRRPLSIAAAVALVFQSSLAGQVQYELTDAHDPETTRAEICSHWRRHLQSAPVTTEIQATQTLAGSMPQVSTARLSEFGGCMALNKEESSGPLKFRLTCINHKYSFVLTKSSTKHWVLIEHWRRGTEGYEDCHQFLIRQMKARTAPYLLVPAFDLSLLDILEDKQLLVSTTEMGTDGTGDYVVVRLKPNPGEFNLIESAEFRVRPIYQWLPDHCKIVFSHQEDGTKPVLHYEVVQSHQVNDIWAPERMTLLIEDEHKGMPNLSIDFRFGLNFEPIDMAQFHLEGYGIPELGEGTNRWRQYLLIVFSIDVFGTILYLIWRR